MESGQVELGKPGLNSKASLDKNAEEDVLALPRAADLFFLSYRFSQGIPKLQENIWKYLALEHPSWKMSQELIDNLKREVSPRIEKFVAGSKDTRAHLEQTSQLIKQSIGAEIDNMAAVFNGEEEIENKEALLLKICKDVVDRDHNWLVVHDAEGRPRSSKSSSNPIVDPFLSHFCYYGLEEKKTGAEEYDKMFQEAKKTLWGIFAEEKKSKQGSTTSRFTTSEKFIGVVNNYIETHPDKKEILQQKIPENIRLQIPSLSL